ncbi:MAG: hypothetical protein ACKVVP_15205 [Chloroflexota bacterium]
MRCIIRPTVAFSMRDRRLLRRWAAHLNERSQSTGSALEIRGNSLIVAANEDLAHEVAVAAMVLLGHPFYYEVMAIGLPSSRDASASSGVAEAWPSVPERQGSGSPASR